MSALDDIAAQRQRLTERLTRIEAERVKVAEQIAELETAERVLSRLAGTKSGTGRRARGGQAKTTETAPNVEPRRRGRRAKAKPAGEAAPPRRRAVAAGRRRKSSAAKTVMPLRDATLRAVEGLGNASPEQIRSYIGNQFGMQVRPLHLGRALQSHRRAGRLAQRNGSWSMPEQRSPEAAAAE